MEKTIEMGMTLMVGPTNACYEKEENGACQ